MFCSKAIDLYKLISGKLIIELATLLDIADFAFSNCPNIKSISISNTVEWLGIGAFSGSKLPNNMVIPSSVRNICVYALCSTNTISITMPGNFNRGSSQTYEEDYMQVTNGFKTVHFNTHYEPCLKDSLLAEKFYTKKGDPEYKSYKGIIYTKNGKTLIQVPYKMKNINIRKA